VRYFFSQSHGDHSGCSAKKCALVCRSAAKCGTYLSSPNFTIWQNSAGVALAIYVQVIEDFGWDAMQRVLSSYETGKSSTYPKDTQGQVDLLWSKYSIESGEDLSPLLRKWGIPFTSNLTSKVTGLAIYT
jgi:hypothetical protein